MNISGPTHANEGVQPNARVAAILRRSPSGLIGFSVCVCIASLLFWETDALSLSVGLVALAALMLSLPMGYRAHRFGLRPFRGAFSLSWRLGMLCTLLLAFAECLLTDYTASFTIAYFPLILAITMAIFASGFLVAYFIAVMRHMANWKFVRRDVIPVAGILLAIAGLIVSILQIDPAELSTKKESNLWAQEQERQDDTPPEE